MRNRYAGCCRWCGKIVEPNTGNVMGSPGKWEFSHDHCIPEMKRTVKRPPMEYEL